MWHLNKYHMREEICFRWRGDARACPQKSTVFCTAGWGHMWGTKRTPVFPLDTRGITAGLSRGTRGRTTATLWKTFNRKYRHHSSVTQARHDSPFGGSGHHRAKRSFADGVNMQNRGKESGDWKHGVTVHWVGATVRGYRLYWIALPLKTETWPYLGDLHSPRVRWGPLLYNCLELWG